MAKTKKRRVKKTRQHQTLKSSDSGRNINWTRILLIVIGITITLVMVIGMIRPGGY